MHRAYVDQEELGLRQSGMGRRPPFIVEDERGRPMRAESVVITDDRGNEVARLVYSKSHPRGQTRVHAWLEITGPFRLES